MMHFNLAGMSTATTGTGTITLGAALTGFLSFANAGVVDGDKVTYAIKDGNNREIGRGTYTASGTTLSRDSIKGSTNGGAAISLSGSAEVYLTLCAEDMPSMWPGNVLNRPLPHLPTTIHTSGTGAAIAEDVDNRGYGCYLTTGTTSTGVVSGRWNGGATGRQQPLALNVHLAGWVWLEDLSTALEEYRFAFGFSDEWVFGGPGAAGVWIHYDRAVDGANWRCVTRSASTSTNADSGVAAAADTPTLLEILYDSASKVRFKINGAVVATNTTNVPATSSQLPTVVFLKKTVGTTARVASLFSPTYRKVIN